MTDDQATSGVPDLDAIERKAAIHYAQDLRDDIVDDVLALVAHARALRAEVAALQDCANRYQAALERIAHLGADRWSRDRALDALTGQEYRG